VGGANPTVMLVQGSFSLEPEDPARVWSPSPAGLIVFGGAGLARFRDAEALACGNVSDCSGDASGFAFTAGGTFWLTRFLGAEGSYVRPSKTTARGSGSNFRFDSSYDVHVTTIAGKVGAPIGSVRLYGRAGANYHKAASSSTLTTDDVTTTVDGVSTTVEGGTQTIELKTDGWGWLFGGGIEVWLARSFALSGDFGVADLNGKALGGGEGEVDDRLSYVFVGAHIRIFGR
jgi:hypothetical protein